MKTKKCIKCGIAKELESFLKQGTSNICKDCNSKYMREYYERRKNNEDFKLKREEYAKSYVRPRESIERHKQKTKEWKQKNKEHLRNYQRNYDKEHREEKNARQNKWKADNKEKVKEYQQKDYNKRRNDPMLKIKDQIRNRIGESFRKKGFIKDKKLELILCCSLDEFVEHLLQTYKKNYGVEWDGIEKVHIDHIIPLKNAQTKEEVYELCNYQNLQLLKSIDNLRKNDKINWHINS